VPGTRAAVPLTFSIALGPDELYTCTFTVQLEELQVTEIDDNDVPFWLVLLVPVITPPLICHCVGYPDV
jgi:hypothetical protein